MDRTFKSKVGWWYHLLIVLMVLACIKVILGQNPFIMTGVLLTTALILHVFLNTYYVITADGMLIARCGFFPPKTIPIGEIEALEPSVFPGFSYALSLERISIWREGNIWMLVSPENEKEFVKTLRSINPNIQIRDNTTMI